jgi:hypothetical protein
MTTVVDTPDGADSHTKKASQAPVSALAEVQPWSGSLDEDQLTKPGGALIAALTVRAQELGHKLNEMCTFIGVTYAYFNQLRNGIRETNKINREVINDIANYLGRSRVAVMALAGMLTVEDLSDTPHILDRALERAWAFMKDDPKWGPFVPHDLESASMEAKLFVIRLYEGTTKCVLLPEETNLVALAAGIKEISEERARRLQLLEQGT